MVQTLMEIVPGERLGCFVLGMGVNDVLELLRKNFVPLRPRVEVVYSATHPLECDLLLSVESFGLILRFDPKSQRLRVIDLHQPNKLALSYSGVTIGSETRKIAKKNNEQDWKGASFLELYRIFGPTYPGSYDTQTNKYALRYKGLCLMFALDPKHADRYGKGNELPLELPEGGSPQVDRIMLYCGYDEKAAGNPPKPSGATIESIAPILAPEVKLTSLTPSYLEEVCFKITRDRKATPPTVLFLGRNRSIRIGDSVQDILSELGEPSQVYFRQDNRMRIHSSGTDSPRPTTSSEANRPSNRGDQSTLSDVDSDVENADQIPIFTRASDKDPHACFQASDYFYNYFGLGLDLLIDASSHRLKKVIVHTNIPGHSSFSQYNKCEFRVMFVNPPDPQPLEEDPEQSSRSRSLRMNDCVIVKPELKWNDVEALLGPCGRPMIHDKGVVANPFGATYLYAYESCVFEVMRSGHIASVTIF